MKLCKFFLVFSAALMVFSTAALARDFSWTRDFNITAKADPIEFKANFAKRFNLSDMQVIALLNIFDTPADAYIMLRFGEMQGLLKSLTKEQGIAAIKKYRHNKAKGWDKMARILGVDSGSKEFQSLKQGHDLKGSKMKNKIFYSASYGGRDVKKVGN